MDAPTSWLYSFRALLSSVYLLYLYSCLYCGSVKFNDNNNKKVGCWSRDAVSTIWSIGRLQALRLGLDPGETISHLFQRLSVALWRGDAQMWSSRFPIPPPSVDGVIWLFLSLPLLLYLSLSLCLTLSQTPTLQGFQYLIISLFCVLAFHNNNNN